MLAPFSPPLIIAHRGESKYAPENTLPSFEGSLCHRPEMVELDYHMSYDNEFIVIHDDLLDRTTDAVKKWKTSPVAVKKRTLAEIKTLDAGSWFDRGNSNFHGTKIPTLKEALDCIQKKSSTLIERKEGNPEDLVHFLEINGWSRSVIVLAFEWDFIEKIKLLSSETKTGAGGPPDFENGKPVEKEKQFLTVDSIERIKKIGAEVIVWDEKVTKESIFFAHKNNLRVFVYTIDNPKEAEYLASLGVDGIITNDPKTIAERLRK